MTEQKIHNEDWQIGIKRIENNTIDLVVTDPPYGMAFQSNHRKVNELKKIIQEAVRTEVRKVLREELKSLSLTENIKEEISKPKVQEFKEHNLTRSPRKPLVNFGVKNLLPLFKPLYKTPPLIKI